MSPNWGHPYIGAIQVVARRTLRQFWQRRRQAEGPIRAWYATVSKAHWQTPNDVKRQFGGNVDFVKAIRPLRSEADYDAALAEIERCFGREPEHGSPDADRFDLLALVIGDYKRRCWPIDPPDPVEAIKFRMQTSGYSQADLGRILGSRQRASDILGRKRQLTLDMAWKLHHQWDIPADR